MRGALSFFGHATRELQANSYFIEERFGKGLEISKDEFEKNREFYTRHLVSGGADQEGSYVYSDLRVWFN